MKIKLPSFKLNIAQLLQALPYLTLSLSIIGIAYTAWFIYNDIVLGAQDAVALESLKKDVIQTRLNTNLFDEVSIEYTKKSEQSEVNINNLRNPFEFVNQVPQPAETPNVEPLVQ